MSNSARDEILARVTSHPGKPGSPRPVAADGPAELDWAELGLVVEGLAYGQRPIKASSLGIRRQYNLGPRGTFILSLISGGVTYPLELATALHVGRSLITAELDRLREAALITATPGEDDKRRSQLRLTPLGEQACDEVRAAMRQIIVRNLATYSADEVRLFARMLHDVRQLDADESEGDLC